MFLRQNVLNNLMKKAYRTRGLKVGQVKEGWISIKAGYWQVEIKKDFIPNKTLGNIIALVGDLPQYEQAFLVSKERKEEIPYSDIGIIDSDAYKDGMLTITNTQQIGTEETVQRFLQDEDTGCLYLVNEVFVDIVDNGEILKDKGEYAPGEPFYHQVRGILYMNNVCKLIAGFRTDDKNNKVMEALKGVDLIPEIEV